MADRLTPEQRHFNMTQIRGKNTKPEIIVRKALHAMGFRFRLHRGDLPGRPDIVLPKWRTIIFVHGCFWHGHDCRLFRWPATQVEFWQTKITANRNRDQVTTVRLTANGWRVVTVWECAIKGKWKLPSEEFLDALRNAISGDTATEIRSLRD